LEDVNLPPTMLFPALSVPRVTKFLSHPYVFINSYSSVTKKSRSDGKHVPDSTKLASPGALGKQP
jgi:hypothetical protein